MIKQHKSMACDLADFDEFAFVENVEEANKYIEKGWIPLRLDMHKLSRYKSIKQGEKDWVVSYDVIVVAMVLGRKR